MRPFDAAYLRLTAWYVAIIMTISLLFSVWVYNQARNELRFGLDHFVAIKPLPQDSFQTLIEDRLSDSHARLVRRLVLLNLAVFAGGAGASYWLARCTMRPIEESVEAQERFTADAAHELRTPLAAMKAEIEVSLRDPKFTKDDAVQLLQSNLEEVDRLGGLTEGLLTLTQSDAPLTAEPISLEEAAARVVQRMQPLANARHITIVREFKPVIVQGDEAALGKIIGILLDNAIKYSPERTAITLRTYHSDGQGCLEVQDQGIGIKAGELPHIFDRFYRADSSRSKLHVAGHGLGLSIAQYLAERMGAVITVTSTPGKGTVFTLCLPTE